MMTAERLCKTHKPDKRLLASIDRLLKALQKELSDLDGQIRDAVRSSPIWREKDRLLESVPGVGPAIASRLIAELPELGSLTRREIAAPAALAPWTRESGKWKGKRFIGGGRADVRSALFMGAMVASQHNSVLKAFYERLLAAGKLKMVALIAVAREFLTILNAMLRDNKPWTLEIAHARDESPASIAWWNKVRGGRAGQGRKPRQRERASARLDAIVRPGHDQNKRITLDTKDSRFSRGRRFETKLLNR
jgi:transposase